MVHPQRVETKPQTRRADNYHPDASHEVDTALGEGTDTAPLTPTAAQEGI